MAFSILNLIQYSKTGDRPATVMNMVQSMHGGGRALDQARRPRVVKPPDERRRDILDAATRLFGERGFDTATIQLIAREAGVAAGTVYLYFPSKESILESLEERFESGLLDRFGEISEEVLAEEDERGEIVGYEETVDRLIDGLVGFSLEHRALAETLARHAGRLPGRADDPVVPRGLSELLGRVIREGVRLGYVQTADPETTAYLLTLAAVTSIGHAIAARDDALLTKVVDGIKELYVKALAPRQRATPGDQRGHAPEDA
jgi:AcrR family transcriptional regulator